MKDPQTVISLLNDLLTQELTAINQYFVHAKLCTSWGYGRLADKVRDESIEEMKHADILITRIIYLEGIPNVQRLGKVNVGETVPEQFALDLELEKQAIGFLNEGMETCRKLEDYGTFEILGSILGDEEKHLDWLQTQLALIERLGEAPYLAQQLGG